MFTWHFDSWCWAGRLQWGLVHFTWRRLPAVARNNLNSSNGALRATCWKLLSKINVLGQGGCCVILPLMCETGGLSVPCIYVLLSLTWCNGTCSNNSRGTAAQRDSLQKLSFAAALCLIWILLEHEWLVGAITAACTTATGSVLSYVQTNKKTHHFCCHGDLQH